MLRYNLLLQDILKSLKESGVADNHPDIENIPQVMEIIDLLAKATQKGVAVNEAKVQLWQYQHSLDGGRFGPRTVKDLDLLNPMRELIHRGKVFRQPEGTIGSSWAELTVLLFDNYCESSRMTGEDGLMCSPSGQDGEAVTIEEGGREDCAVLHQSTSKIHRFSCG